MITSDELDLLSSEEIKLFEILVEPFKYWFLNNAELFVFVLFVDEPVEDEDVLSMSSRFSMYSIAFRSISTLGKRWLGLGQVRFLSVSKASFTFRRRRLSRIVACLRRSGVELFFLQTLQAHVKHLRPFELAVHTWVVVDIGVDVLLTE